MADEAWMMERFVMAFQRIAKSVPWHQEFLHVTGTLIAVKETSSGQHLDFSRAQSTRMPIPVRIEPSKSRKTWNRSGVVTLEFIIAAPIVFIAVIAIFEFGFLAITLQFGHAALIEGTRRGAELYPETYPLDADGADNDISDAIVEIMNDYLAIHCLEIFDPTQGFADNGDLANVQILIERNGMMLTRGADVNYAMSFTCTPSGDPPDANEIRVTLCFPLVDADNPSGSGRPVPDWLSLYGMSLANCVFQVSSRRTLE
jgi:hypothetical protein